MKVLFVSEFWDPDYYGGGERSAKTLREELIKKGVDVGVLTSGSAKKEGIFRRLKTGRPDSLIGNIKRLFFQYSLKKEIRKMRGYDIIHFLNVTPIPSFKVDTQTCATLNSYVPFCPKGNLFYKEKEVCSGCSPLKFIRCMMKSTQAGKIKLRWYLKYNPLFLLLIYFRYKRFNRNLKNIDHFFVRSSFFKRFVGPCTIEPPIVSKTEMKSINIPKGHGTKIVFLGGDDAFKGGEILINALKGMDVTVYTNSKLKGENVVNVGKLTNKEAMYLIKECDVVVIPSLWPEPLSRIMIEALTLGKPIIATNRGGNVDGIEGNGFLVEPEEIASAVRKITPQMGARSKEIFEEKFSTQSTVKRVIESYDKIMKE